VNRRILVIPQKFFALIKQVTNRVNLGDLDEKSRTEEKKAYAKAGAAKPMV